MDRAANLNAPRGGAASRTVPLTDGEPCGDAAACFDLPGDGPARLLAIVDGLGHGAEAAGAADAALRILAAQPDLPLPELMQRLDAGLADTRGAAVGLVRVRGLHLQHAGLGNTRTVCSRDGHATHLPSQPGIVGGGLPARVVVSELALQPGDWLLLFTDGLSERVSLPVHLPEWRRAPALLCDHLLQHWRGARDDAGVLVMPVEGA